MKLFEWICILVTLVYSINCDIIQYKKFYFREILNELFQKYWGIKMHAGICSPEIFAPYCNLRAQEIKRRGKEKKKEAYAKENAFTRTFAYYLPCRYPSAYATISHFRMDELAPMRVKNLGQTHCCRVLFLSVVTLRKYRRNAVLSRRFREMKTKVPNNVGEFTRWTHISGGLS